MTDSLDSAKSTSQSHTASCMQTSKQQLNPQIDDDASPHHLPRPQCAPPHLEWRPAGAVHVCFSESDEDFSHALIRDLREHGHDVTDCQRSPVPGQPELKQMAALVQSAVWVVGVVSLAALDSIWFTMQLHWALDVAVDRGMCQLILVLQPDVNVDLLPPLLEFFPQIWTANEEWKTELQYLLSGRPTPLPDNHRRLVEEQAFLCGAQASLWSSLSTPSLDRASSLQSLDSRPQVPLSVWSRFLQRTQRSLLTSRDQAVASLNSVPEVSDGLQQTSEEEAQFLACGPDTAELQTEGAVHFLHREEDEGHVREVKGWLESEGVRCTDSGLSVRPGEWELPQLQSLVTCAAWVVVMVTLGSLDSMMLDLLCQVACLEAFRRGSANVVVVLAHPRLRGLLPQVLSPFHTLLAADGKDWRSRLKDLVTSLPPPLTREEVGDPGPSAVQHLWKAASACSLERQPGPYSSTQAVSSTEDSMGSRPILPLWLWPSVASRQRKAQLKTAAEQQALESRIDRANRERSATHATIDMTLDDNDGVSPTDENACSRNKDRVPTTLLDLMCLNQASKSQITIKTLIIATIPVLTNICLLLYMGINVRAISISRSLAPLYAVLVIFKSFQLHMNIWVIDDAWVSFAYVLMEIVKYTF